MGRASRETTRRAIFLRVRWRRSVCAGLGLLGTMASAPAAAAAECPPAPADYAPASEAGTDPLTGSQWGLDQIKVRAAWQRGLRGQGVTVAVVDTGVDTTHPDLAPNLVGGGDMLARSPCPQDDAGA